MLSEDLIYELYRLQENFISTHKKIERKEIKVVIDSILEQLGTYYFNKVISIGDLNIRSMIKSKVEQNLYDEEDNNILRSLDDIIREYYTVFNKSYSNYEDTLEGFFDNQIRQLTINLNTHSYFENSVNIKKIMRLYV